LSVFLNTTVRTVRTVRPDPTQMANQFVPAYRPDRPKVGRSGHCSCALPTHREDSLPSVDRFREWRSRGALEAAADAGARSELRSSRHPGMEGFQRRSRRPELLDGARCSTSSHRRRACRSRRVRVRRRIRSIRVIDRNSPCECHSAISANCASQASSGD
jgi:hypothetical protein